MRQTSFLFTMQLAVVLLAGCGSVRDQVIEPVLEGAPDSDLLVYRGDSVQLTYWLWDQKGVMAFAIYNATDRPIYVDWYKSALIHQGTRLPYWADRRSVKIEGFSQGSALTIGDVNRYMGTFTARTHSTGSFTGSIVESKPERISFIPPKSRLFINTRWNLMSGSFASGWTKSMVPASYMPKRMEEIKVREYAREDTPLTFRNFLTWSFTEDFGQEFHVDNAFWVRRVTSMTNKQFKGLRLSNEGPPPYPYAYPYGGGDRFYFEFKD